MAERVIKVGADPFPPYQFINEEGKAAGSDYERVSRIFREAGYEIEVLIDEWSVVEEKFLSGELDALFQVQKSPEREEKFRFSSLLRNAVTEVLTSDKELVLRTYQEIADRGLKLGVLERYAYGKEIDELPESCKQKYESSEKLLFGIADGEVNVGVFDQGVKEYMMEKMNIQGIYPIQELEFLRPLYIMYH